MQMMRNPGSMNRFDQEKDVLQMSCTHAVGGD